MSPSVESSSVERAYRILRTIISTDARVRVEEYLVIQYTAVPANASVGCICKYNHCISRPRAALACQGSLSYYTHLCTYIYTPIPAAAPMLYGDNQGT